MRRGSDSAGAVRAEFTDGVDAPHVNGTYPPEQVAEAQRLTMAGGMRGRAVIVF